MNTRYIAGPSLRRPSLSTWRLFLATGTAALALVTAAQATTYWVSPTGGGNGQSSGSPWTLAEANASTGLKAGDTARLKAGTYTNQQIAPVNNGTSSLPITYIKDSGIVTLSGSPSGLAQVNLTGKTWIVIDGLSFVNSAVYSAVRIDNSTFIKIRNCNFASGANGGPNGDHIYHTYSSNTLIEGCTFGNAVHQAVNIQRGSRFVIVQNCLVQNTWHTNVEAFTGDAGSSAAVANIVYQDNRLYDAGTGQDNNPGANNLTHNGLEGEAQNCIFRRNIIDAINPNGYDIKGMTMTSWVSQSSTGNRIYNNIFSRQRYGVYLDGDATNPPAFVDRNNVWKNNIFYLNTANPVLASGLDSTGNSLFAYNNFYGVQTCKYKGTTGDYIAIQNAYGTEWQNNVGSVVGGNKNPQFTNLGARDFTLLWNSPMIDAGDFLTTTTGSGTNSRTVAVVDARYFHNGFGITTGDMVVVGSNQARLVTAVNYTSTPNTLTLDPATPGITWSTGAKVSLQYSGAKPDMGVFEYTSATAPAAPSGLTASSPTSSSINLSWTDNSSNETGFEIDRATNSAFTTGPSPITNAYTAAANATGITATGLSPSTLYYFRARATNGLDSPNSNTASNTTSSGGATNLAPDPGFETDPNVDYATNGTATYSWATDFFHGGSRSIKNVSTQAAGTLTRWFSRTTEIPVTPGSSYTTSAWFKTTSVTDHAVLTINYWDASQVVISSASSTNLTGTANWTQKTVTSTAPANAAYIRVEFRLYGPGTLWADDVSVIKN